MNIIGLAHFLPKVSAILYAILLFASSASVAARDNNPGAFFVDGFGRLITANEMELSENINVAVEKRKAGISDWFLTLDIIGNILLFYYMVKIFHFALNKSFEMSSQAMLWVWSIAILFLIETIALTAVSGGLYVGFSGITNAAFNADSIFYPFYGWVETIGEASIKSPIF